MRDVMKSARREVRGAKGEGMSFGGGSGPVAAKDAIET